MPNSTEEIARPGDLKELKFDAGDPGLDQLPTNEELGEHMPFVRLLAVTCRFDDEALAEKVRKNPDMFMDLVDEGIRVKANLEGLVKLVDAGTARCMIVMDRIVAEQGAAGGADDD